MKILSVVGARPEFIQAMPVSQALSAQHQEILVHTGQHYDHVMSRQFFEELPIPTPNYNLDVGSGSHAVQTAGIMLRLEQVCLHEKPDFVIVRGDTNSTLAAALVAAKLCIPFAHIEAGERSFNRRMPEEINRLIVDQLAHFHFCVSALAVSNLLAEGIQSAAFQVGDVMLDAINFALPLARSRPQILEHLGLRPRSYALATIHRSANTDDPQRLRSILLGLRRTGEKVILPLHPRTRKVLQSLALKNLGDLRIIEPVGYLDMLNLEQNARLIATDSGGVQREAYYLSVPCLTLRDETEWVDTVRVGWNRLVGADSERILQHWFNFTPPSVHPQLYGDGTAAQKIVNFISQALPLQPLGGQLCLTKQEG